MNLLQLIQLPDNNTESDLMPIALVTELGHKAAEYMILENLDGVLPQPLGHRRLYEEDK